jgi:hypothetical protein
MAKASIKHLQIDKDQTTILVVIAITTAVAVFGLFGIKALVSKGLYQKRALHARRDVADKLKSNFSDATTLFTQYKVFAEQQPNLLGGQAKGNGSQDGDNARLVLDSLPSKYDAPALASSIEKVLTDQNFKFTRLSVEDDPAANPDTPETKPTEKTITFTFAGSTTYGGAVKVLQAFERSIRPFDITNLQITGTDQALQITANVNTYYQPAKILNLSPTKEVK